MPIQSFFCGQLAEGVAGYGYSEGKGLLMKCPDCDGKVSVGQLQCKDCGRSLADLDLIAMRAKSVKDRRRLLSLFVVAVVVAVGGVAAKNYVDQQNAKEAARVLATQANLQAKLAREAAALEQQQLAAEIADYSWVPKGFTKFATNHNMAYKSISYDSADCYSNCWGFQVISRDACSSIKVSANIQRDDVILDTDSDYATDVPAQTRVIMRITSSADLPWNAMVTESTCT